MQNITIILQDIIMNWYLSAIEIIDTQVARRGRQYHSQPTLQNEENKSILVKFVKIILNLPLKKNSPKP